MTTVTLTEPTGSQNIITFSTITAAVNAANAAYAANPSTDPTNTVSVGPGTYVESNISITSPMTLVSTNGAASTTIEGYITGNDEPSTPNAGIIDVTGTTGSVTIGNVNKGFTLQNPPQRSSDEYVNIINVANIAAPLTIQDNTLIGLDGIQDGVDDPFDVGVYVDNSQAAGLATVQSNTFEEMWQGVLYEVPLGGGAVSNNIFENLQPSYYNGVAYEPEGIFALTYGGAADNVSGLSIIGNDFSQFNGLAISVDGGYAGLAPAQFSDVQISNNVITSIGFTPDEYRAGITLIDDAPASQEAAGGVVDSIVSNNTLQAQTAGSAGSVGVWLLGGGKDSQGKTNLTIDNNSIDSLDSGILIQQEVASGGYASGVVANKNSFVGNNIGILNSSPNLVDASYNYWGATDSTSVKAQANGGVNVVYNPWLGSGTTTTPGVGFSPTLTPLIIDAYQLTGNDSVEPGATYTASISLTPLTTGESSQTKDLGSLSNYSISFGDGSPATGSFSGNASAMHSYPASSQSNQTYLVTASLANMANQTFQIANTLSVTAPKVSTLVVTSFTPTASGFHVRFSDTLKTSVLNLYTSVDQLTSNGPPDVTVTGPSGIVYGSLKLDSDNKGFTFVQTGAPLAPGTYSVTLVGATGGIVDSSTGYPLDGTQSGSTSGSNYTTTYTVASNSGPTVTIPDFARGPGQPVILPAATGTTLPIQISIPSGGASVTSITVVFTYNPALLTISGVSLDRNLPALTQLETNATVPGRLSITVTTASSMGYVLSSGNLVDLTASVPTSALYNSKAVLGLQVVSTNGTVGLGTGDQSIDLATYLGNASGLGYYNPNDITSIREVTISPNAYAGFGAYPLVDPVIVGNVSATGNLNPNDATYLREYLTTDDPVPQIPTVTQSSVSFASGPDPELFISQDLAGMPGGSLVVPVQFLQTNDSDIELQSFTLAIAYDPTAFSVSGIDTGSLAAGFQLSEQVDAAQGLIIVSGTSSQPLTLSPGTLGDLIKIDFNVLANAMSGSYSINLLDNAGSSDTSLNGGGLTLVPAPTNAGNDPTDGQVAIGGRVAPSPFRPGFFLGVTPNPTMSATTQGVAGSSADTIASSPSLVTSTTTQVVAGSSVGPIASPSSLAPSNPSPVATLSSEATLLPLTSTLVIIPSATPLTAIVSTLSSDPLATHDLAIATIASDSTASTTIPLELIPLTVDGLSSDLFGSAPSTVPTGMTIATRRAGFRYTALTRVALSPSTSDSMDS